MWFFGVPPEKAITILGKNGRTRRLIEERFKVSLSVDNETGSVSVKYGPDSAAEAYLAVTKIMSAISAGFDEETIHEMIERDLSFVVLDLEDVVGRERQTLTRVKGRIIGEKGKAKQRIEAATGCTISVYGNKVGILGPPEATEVAREAVERLTRGFQHQTVYRFLELRAKRLQERGLWSKEGEP